MGENFKGSTLYFLSEERAYTPDFEQERESENQNYAKYDHKIGQAVIHSGFLSNFQTS